MAEIVAHAGPPLISTSSAPPSASFGAASRVPGNPHLEHEQAKTELKCLMPEDAKEAIGRGIRAKGSSPGAVSFDRLPNGLAKGNNKGRAVAMQQSSESIASLAAALARVQIELANPEKSVLGTIKAGPGEGPEIGLSALDTVLAPYRRGSQPVRASITDPTIKLRQD